MVQTGLAAIGETGASVATGFVKGMGDTVSGVSHLIHKIPGGVGEALAPEAGITSLDQRDVANGTAEMAGKGLEGIAEFATGDEALEGLSKASKLVALAKKYPAIAETLNMASKNKILEKIITGAKTAVGNPAARAAIVGTGQGAVKGAQEDNAVKGAVVGGVTAGATGALTEAAPDIFNWMARKAGMGGQDFKGAMTIAGRPSVAEGKKFATALDGTKDILTTIPNKSIKDVGDFEDAVHNKANELWQTQVKPDVDSIHDKLIDLSSVRDNVQAAATRSMKKYFPNEAREIEEFANHFGKSTVGEADEDLQMFNARLKKFYRMNSVDQNAALQNQGAVASLESAADGLRDKIYSTIDEEKGYPAGTTATLRRQYGQLKDIERTFGKRAVVVDRQAPLNMTQVLAMTVGAGRLLAGDPTEAVAAAMPWMTKTRGSAKSLIKQGLNDAREQAGSPALGDRVQSAIGKASKAIPSIATQAANAAVPQGTPELQKGFVRIQDSRGGVHDVPQESLTGLQQKDAGIKILGGE
jgi:hypothetical protein